MPPRRWDGADVVAIIVAGSLACVTIAVVVVAAVQITTRFSGVTLSENVTQLLIASIGGQIGVLGGYIGYRTAKRDDHPDRE